MGFVVPSFAVRRGEMGLGLASALALLAACGPTRGPTDQGSDDAADDGQPATMGSSATGSTGDSGGGMCSFEAFQDHPDRLTYLGMDCLPALDDGSCGECDAECIDTSLGGCPFEGCGLPDVGCYYGCADQKVLCHEQREDECCWVVTASYGGTLPGRPLREHGLPLLPELDVDDAVSEEASRASAAATYRAFARYERASVDAFEHAASCLQGLGAPPEIVSDHLRSAEEERHHAVLALAAAESLDGRRARLGDMPDSKVQPPVLSFVRALVYDGCIGESLAAEQAAWALEQQHVRDDATLSEYWRHVARDEAGHAKLAWRTLEWLLAARPDLEGTVIAELRAATRRFDQDDDDGDADRFGIPSAGTRVLLHKRAIAKLVHVARATAASHGEHTLA